MGVWSPVPALRRSRQSPAAGGLPESLMAAASQRLSKVTPLVAKLLLPLSAPHCAAPAAGIEIAAPMAGTLYRSPAPGEPMFVKVRRQGG